MQFFNPEYKHAQQDHVRAEHYMHVCIWPVRVLNGKNMQGHAVNPSEVHAY